MSEDTVKNWEDYVRKEVNSLLDTYLPNAKGGIVGIKYINPVKAKYESHTVYETDKASAVQIVLEFGFEKIIDIPK